MKNIIRFVLSMVLALFFVSAKSDKIDLKYNLRVGSTYKINTITDLALELNLMGQPQSMKNKMESITAFKVLEIEKNIIKLDTWFEQLKISIETPMGIIVMDSDTTIDESAGSKVIGKLIHKHFSIKMATNGEIVEVTGIDKITEDILNDASGIDAMQLPILKENMKQIASNDAFKGNIEMITYCFPGKPASIGDKWTNKYNLISVMNSQVDSNWQLADSKNGVSFLNGTGKLQSKADGAAQNMNGIPIKYDINGEQKMDSKIDEETGWIIESTIDQNIMGEMSMDFSSQGAGIQKFPIKISGKSVSKGIK